MLLWCPLFTKDIETLDKVQNIDPKLSEFAKDTFILKFLGIGTFLVKYLKECYDHNLETATHGSLF